MRLFRAGRLTSRVLEPIAFRDEREMEAFSVLNPEIFEHSNWGPNPIVLAEQLDLDSLKPSSGRLDMLLLYSGSGPLVVIEFKVVPADNKDFVQIKRYREALCSSNAWSWIKGKGLWPKDEDDPEEVERPIYGVLAAPEFDQELLSSIRTESDHFGAIKVAQFSTSEKDRERFLLSEWLVGEETQSRGRWVKYDSAKAMLSGWQMADARKKDIESTLMKLESSFHAIRPVYRGSGVSLRLRTEDSVVGWIVIRTRKEPPLVLWIKQPDGTYNTEELQANDSGIRRVLELFEKLT